MRLPANINRLRNTARWTPLAFWFLDTQILHSTIHRSLSLDSYFDKQESWGTSFLISLFPDHPMTLSWSCRRVRPSGANQNTSDKVRVLGIVILISHSPEYPMTLSWRCKTVRPTGQTITQLHSTLDSRNLFLGVLIAVERVLPLPLRDGGNCFWFRIYPRFSFSPDLRSGLDAPIPEDTDRKASVATVAKNEIKGWKWVSPPTYLHFDIWTCIISNWWCWQFSFPFKWRNNRCRKSYSIVHASSIPWCASTFTDTPPSSLQRTPSRLTHFLSLVLHWPDAISTLRNFKMPVSMISSLHTPVEYQS